MTSPSFGPHQDPDVVRTRIQACASQGLAVLVLAPDRKLSKRRWDSFHRRVGRIVPGFDMARAVVFDATGERTAIGATRPIFNNLVAAVQGGQVGLVAVVTATTQADDCHLDRLYDALAERDCLLIEHGLLYDPGNESHRLTLRLRAPIGRFEAEQRALFGY